MKFIYIENLLKIRQFEFFLKEKVSKTRILFTLLLDTIFYKNLLKVTKLNFAKVTVILLLLPLLSIAQTNCKYDIEEKTDSTYLKVLPEKVMYERVFGDSKEFLQFSLINNNGIPTLHIQLVEKNSLFLSAKCLDLNSKILFQLNNGKFVTLKSITDNTCSLYNYNEKEKANIRILDGYFVFTKTNYEELKSSPISVMRLQFVGDKKDYNINSDLASEITKLNYAPSYYFIDYLKCVE